MTHQKIPNYPLPNWLTLAINQQTDASWHVLLTKACQQLSTDYLEFLSTHDWLPGPEKIFNAFILPIDKINFILYGESPYPREASANGFAFWDGAVGEIWSESGLSKAVNRATSLRNFFKMLRSIDNTEHFDQRINTLNELFHKLLSHGFLLLNFNLSLSHLSKTKEAKYWAPFHQSLLQQLAEKKITMKQKTPQLILFGKIAEQLLKIPSSKHYQHLIAEHPYNLSFINNLKVKKFFQPFNLLNNSNLDR